MKCTAAAECKTCQSFLLFSHCEGTEGRYSTTFTGRGDEVTAPGSGLLPRPAHISLLHAGAGQPLYLALHVRFGLKLPNILIRLDGF
jgi:hypothetical protein